MPRRIVTTIGVVVAFILNAILFFLLGMVFAGAYGNPLAPATEIASAPTSTLFRLATQTPAPTATPSPAATATGTPTGTPTALPPTPTDTPTPAPTATITPTPFTYDAAALEVIAYVNQWRIGQGVAPLKPNPVLTQMANDQANYWMNSGFRSSPHLDAEGRDPHHRALEVYLWPPYGEPAIERIAVGENAAVDSVPRNAVDWWASDKTHRTTMVNDKYREIGTAAIASTGGGFVYYAIFGAQPDVLPALVDASAGLIYLSDELYEWAAGGDWMQPVTGVQVLPSADAEPDPAAWQDWTPTIALPASPGPWYIALTDGERVLVLTVDPAVDVVWLPGNLP